MKNIYKSIALALAILGVSSTTNAFATTGDNVTAQDSQVNVEITLEEENLAAPIYGWYKVGDKWFYYDETGVEYRNKWLNSNGNWYYFDANAVMVTYPIVVNGKTYGFNQDGKMLSNTWYKYSGRWYYLGETGAAATGWAKIDGTWYYFKPENAIMLCNTVAQINGEYYLFDKTGAMLSNGWHKSGGDWYYLYKSGAAKKGWLLENGKWYFLNRGEIAGKGIATMAVAGPHVIDGHHYFFNESGVMVE